MKLESKMTIQELQKENNELKTKLDNALRDLAESVRSEIEHIHSRKVLYEKIGNLKKELQMLKEIKEA